MSLIPGTCEDIRCAYCGPRLLRASLYTELSSFDPHEGEVRRMLTAQVALLNIDACDRALAGNASLVLHIKRATALWQCLAEIHDSWGRGEVPDSGLLEGWDVCQSFERIYRKFFSEWRCMQALAPGLGCLEHVSHRLQPPKQSESLTVLHYVQLPSTRWEAVH